MRNVVIEDQALTRLIQDALAGGLTVRELAARSVDPVTGYAPSKTLIGDIKLGAPVKLRPELVRAIAAGIGRPEIDVALAAAEQYAGLDVTRVFEAAVRDGAFVSAIHEAGKDPEGPLNRAHIRRIEDEEFGLRRQSGESGSHKP